MARIIQLLIGINALAGIATFVGARLAARKAKEKLRSALDRSPEERA